MGRPQFQTLTASLPSEALATLGQAPATTVAAAGSEQITYYAPVGTKATVWGAYLQANAPTGATSGTHGLAVSVSGYNLTQGTSNYGDVVTFLNGYWSSATTAAQPNTGLSPQSWWLGVVQFDSVEAIVLTYTNNTNATSPSGARNYHLLVNEVNLA